MGGALSWVQFRFSSKPIVFVVIYFCLKAVTENTTGQITESMGAIITVQ